VPKIMIGDKAPTC